MDALVPRKMKEAVDCHKLRGAVKQALIRRCPNGETHYGEPIVPLPEYIGHKDITMRTETSK